MTKTSVTARSLSSNDLASLAQILEITLQHYCKHRSPFEQDYVKKLSTIVGLGFTAILVDGDLLPVYEQYLQTFIRHRHFKAHPEFISVFSRAIAEIIDGAVFVFRLVKRPQYYDTFVMAVKSAAAHITILEAGKAEEAERLMSILFQKHS